MMDPYFEYLNKVREVLARLDNLSRVLVCLEVLFKEGLGGDPREQIRNAV